MPTVDTRSDAERYARDKVDSVYNPKTYTAEEVQKLVAAAYSQGRTDQDEVHRRKCGR